MRVQTTFSSLGLPNDTNSFHHCDDAYWNLLQVNVGRVKAKIQDSDYAQNQLRKLDSGLIRILNDWSQTKTTSGSPVETMFEAVNQQWVQTIFLLIEFCETRTYESFRTATQEIISATDFALIDGRFNHQNTNRFALALRVYAESPEKLKFLMLWENADRRSFERYSLIPSVSNEDDNSDDEQATRPSVEEMIERGVQLTNIDQAGVNKVLETFEEERTSNRESQCEGVLQIADDESCWVFIRRQYRETYVQEVRQTVFADEAELVIIHFGDRIREIDIRYEHKDSQKIADAIASKYLDANVEYFPVNESTASRHITSLIDALLSNSDDRLRLIEIDNDGNNMPGNPRVIIRGDKSTGIVSSIRHLRESHNLNFLEELEELRSIKVSYVAPASAGDTSKTYMVTIYLQQLTSDDRYSISYVTRAPIKDRNHFENHMRTTYDITIVPRT
jgi:hypothetical protein